MADIDRRAEISHAANERLAARLATLEERTTMGQLLRALSPLTGNAGRLQRILAQGDFLLKGSRNADLCRAMHGDTADADQRRRRTVTALLATHNREVAHLTAYSGSA